MALTICFYCKIFINRKSLLVAIGILTLLLNRSFSQVNTESLRKSGIKDGFYTTISVYYGINSGNSEFSSFKSTFRSDYQKGRNSMFGVVNLNKANKSGKLFINKGFVHLRGVRTFSNLVFGEIFLQKGYDDFILLKSRDLIGTGIRLNLMTLCSVGENSTAYSAFSSFGFMWEKEVLSIPGNHKPVVRSTNYLSVKIATKQNLGLTLTGYYQPDINHWDDYRVLVSGIMEISISKKISLGCDLQYRFDSEPPPGIIDYDLELVNGITLKL
jgi:hypothetical protein